MKIFIVKLEVLSVTGWKWDKHQQIVPKMLQVVVP